MSKLPRPVILFVSHKYPSSTGGMEKQSFELITGINRRTKSYRIVYNGSESILKFFKTLNKRILSAITEYPDINIIHFNDGLVASLALYHKGYEHLKRVVTVHGLDVVFPLAYFQHKIIPRFNRYDRIIAVSQATAQAIISRGVRPEKVTVIANGIDHHLASLRSEKSIHEILREKAVSLDKKYLVLLGRPVKRKGFSWFIEHVLPQLDKQFHLLIIGPYQSTTRSQEKWLKLLPAKWRHLLMLFLGFPSDEHRIRQLLHSEKYNKRISHLGKLPIDQLKTVLQNATAFLMPNIKAHGDMEGFGLVCLEASICGSVVLASNIEGITDAIHHNKNGFLITHEQPKQWIDRLSDIVDKPDKYLNLSKEFKKFTLTNYSWDKMIREYLSVFEKEIEIKRETSL